MILMLLAAILPVILLAFYIWYKDPVSEPVPLLRRALALGVAICIPVAFAESSISQLLFGTGEPTSLFGTTIKAFLVAAVPEESAKLLALFLVLYKNPWFDEHFDGIVYAVFVGLGFAAFENAMYVLSAGDKWVTVAVMRALLSVPGHYAFAILMGYYYSMYHFVNRSFSNALKVLLVPVLAHGVYDSLAMSGSVDPVAGGICFIVLIYFCIKLQKVAHQKVLSLANSSR